MYFEILWFVVSRMLHQLNEEYSLETYVGDLEIKDLIEFFLSKVGKEGLHCVEKLGQTSVRVYFKDSANFSKFLEEPIIVKSTELTFFRIGEKFKTVFVKGLPFSLPEKLLHDAFKKYGKVRSIGYERYAGYRPVCTGTRILKMKLNSSIPNFLRVGKYMAVISYKNQVKVCRRCGGNNHFAKECNTRREDFREGFPVHTRPVAPRVVVRLGNSNKSTNTEVQTASSTVNNTITIPAQSLNPAIDSVFRSNNVSFITQSINGLRLDAITKNSNCIVGSSSEFEGSIPSLVRPKKGKENGCKEASYPVESAKNCNPLADLCSKEVPRASLASEGAGNVAGSLTERNQCGATSNKRKKKKKKKSNK